MHTVGNPLLWVGFFFILIIMLALDVVVQGRVSNELPSIKQSALWSLLWIALALLFDVLFWTYLLCTKSLSVANSQALVFFTGYLLEKTLAADNVFVWIMLFNYFAIPLPLQHHLLTWGILGAVVLRAVMIFTGSWLIIKFQWLFYIFGIFLLFTGVKIALSNFNKQDVGTRLLVHWICRHLQMKNKIYEDHFSISSNERSFCTMPMSIVLIILLEFIDVIFSLDSIPAILAITTDPFILLTSNLFAIFGLRAMYFLLVKISANFSLFKYGLAVILAFVGIKMLIVDFIYIPIAFSLAMVIITLAVTFILNTWINRRSSQIKHE